MSKPRVALVIAPVGKGGYRDVGMKESLPHIGLAYLAGNLPSDLAEVRIFDAPAMGDTKERLIERLRDYRPGVIGFTAVTSQIDDAHDAAVDVKRGFPNATTIIGGYHASAVPEETLERYSAFDLVVFGEGERTFPELIAELTKSDVAGLPAIPGVGKRIGGEPSLGPSRGFNDDLDSLRFPAYGLMPLERYSGFYTMFLRPRRTVVLSTGRGCPFHCVFCYKATGDKYRTRSIDSVIRELDRNVKEYRIQEFVVSDESFLQMPERVREFCEALIEKGYAKTLKWICQARVDHAEPEILGLMSRAGCRVISFGIESGDPEVLKTIKKKITLDQAAKAIRAAKRAGILTDTNFIIGHPGDTRDTIRETIRQAVRLNAHLASFAIMVPFPGTDVMRMAKNGEGGLRLLSNDYSQFGKQVGGSLELENIPRAELERLQRTAYMRFFLRPSRFPQLFRVVSIKLFILMLARALTGKKS